MFNYLTLSLKLFAGSCGKRGGDRRLRFLVSDHLSNGPVRFYVTCFGRYAEELEESKLSENDSIEISKPYITLKRWQPGEKRVNDICDYEVVSSTQVHIY